MSCHSARIRRSYIFSIVIYELMPEKSLRRAAELTKQTFNMKTYAASTLCRARKKLDGKTLEIIAALAAIKGNISDAANNSVVNVVVDGTGDSVVGQIVDAEGSSIVDLEDNAPPVVDKTEGVSQPFGEICEKDNTIQTGLLGVAMVFRELTEMRVDSIVKNGRGPPGMAGSFAACVSRFCRKYYSMYRQFLI